MPTHKKTPIFLRIIATDKKVICINPSQLSSFEIAEGADIKVKSKDPAVTTPEIVKADTIRFYFPSGTALSYSVGLTITKEEFDYVCSTLLEYLYLNESEFAAKSEAIAKAKMDDWVKISKENEQKSELTPLTAIESTTGRNTIQR